MARLSTDPYGSGWMIRIKLAADARLDHLLDHAAYQRQIAAEGH
ncbi:MAG: hypothetical protein ACRD24_15730 [Terriglobales bacterium]